MAMQNRNGAAIRVGAQAITWGEHIRENLPRILAHLRACGYGGVEIGVRHLDVGRAAAYRELFAEHALHPVAVHSGGTFWDAAQADAEMRNLENAVLFARDTGFAFFTLSGNPEETPDSMKTAARGYARFGALCREHGLQFVYHNHGWEFADDAAIFKVLLAETDPDTVKWVPDIAWMWRAGCDLVGLLREHRERIAYVHLKDSTDAAFCELGRGGVPVADAVALLPELDAAWAVVEQDTTETTPEESLRVSAEYLRAQGVL